jgi:hypothetical protein
MCLGGGGGGGTTKAPVAGGYTEMTIDDGQNKDYKLYDNNDKNITDDYQLNSKKKTIVKKSAGSGGSLVEDAAQYLYTRDA